MKARIGTMRKTMISNPPKFIQIAASGNYLYALDELGTVWFKRVLGDGDNSNNCWMESNTGRK